MLSLTDLLAPVTPDVFRAEYDDQKPLHIPATERTAKRELLDWAGLNTLLDQRSIWTPQTLKVLFKGEPISPNLTAPKRRARSAARLARHLQNCRS